MNRIRTAVILSLTGLLCIPAAPAPAAELCFVPDSQGRNYSVDCVTQTQHPHDWSGYNTAGPPCNSAGVPGYLPCSIVPKTHGINSYGWTLSSSPTDPYAVQGPLGGPVATLYLHLACVFAPEGFTAAGFELAGDLNILAFTPMNGFLNAGTATNPLLAVSCLTATPSVVAGAFIVETAVSVEASSWGRVKSEYR